MALKRGRTETFDIVNDPGLRKPINDYKHSIRDDVKRAYVVQSPCQPRSHAFLKTYIDKITSFHADYFDKWEWMEYIGSKDGAYCYWCYLSGEVLEVKCLLVKHFGIGRRLPRNLKFMSEQLVAHTILLRHYFFLLKIKDKVWQEKYLLETAYRTRLTAVVDVVDVVRLLLQQGLAFRGNNEL
ncbi:unnamed protein product [Rhodiola kirilowii]